MASSSTGPQFRQDMPPKGGYRDIYWKRTHPKTWFNWKKGFGLFALSSAYSYWLFRSERKSIRKMGLIENDVEIACQPFIMAERDRRILRVKRQNRDLEDEVMKDVPGWVTGTWYGEPVYLGSPHSEEFWWDGNANETMAHANRARPGHVNRFFSTEEVANDKFYGKWLGDWYKWFPGQNQGSERQWRGHNYGAESM